MNKHEEVRIRIGLLITGHEYDYLDNYINQAEQTEKELERITIKKDLYIELFNQSNSFLDKAEVHIKEQLHELQLYKSFVNEFKFEIVEENENWNEEYLSHGGATDKALDLFKQIQQIGGNK
jgi:hypothetical protein